MVSVRSLIFFQKYFYCPRVLTRSSSESGEWLLQLAATEETGKYYDPSLDFISFPFFSPVVGPKLLAALEVWCTERVTRSDQTFISNQFFSFKDDPGYEDSYGQVSGGLDNTTTETAWAEILDRSWNFENNIART